MDTTLNLIYLPQALPSRFDGTFLKTRVFDPRALKRRPKVAALFR